MVSLIKFLKEKRWALVAIIAGTILGFSSAILCIAWNLVIFGFNIMYIVSPLLAGFVETIIARRKYGKSTGAISALLTFILINGYGWFGPGYIFPKEPVRLSLITIIAIILTLQAAFPTLINYILIVIGIGTVRKFIAFLIFLPSRIMRRPPEAMVKEEHVGSSADEIFLNELLVPLLSVPPVKGGKIKKYVGIVAGEAVAKEKETEGRVAMLTKIIEPTLLDDIYLGDAREKAMSQMLDEAKSMGANNVIDVLIDYVSMGGLQGSALLVTATGTAVEVEGEPQHLENNLPEEEPKFKSDEKNDVYNVLEKISGKEEKKDISNENHSPVMNKRRVREQIIGKEVINSSARVIGKVKDVEINLDKNEIEAIILSKGGSSESLGLSGEEFVIPYDAVEQVGDRVLIKEIQTDEIDSDDYYSYLENKIRNIE